MTWTEFHSALTTSRLRWVVNAFAKSPNGVMVTDAKGVVVEVNDAFTSVTGYPRNEIIGQNPRILHSGLQSAEFYESMWKRLSEDGAWQGEVTNRRRNGEIVVELLSINAVHDDLGRVTHYVGTFADITRFKEYQRQLEMMAHFDALTQLPNRVLLLDRMQQAIAWIERQGSLMAVCYIDLDNFKPINDRYGHAVGDRVLVEIAERMKREVREGDTVARMGGDEFVLLLTDVDTMFEVEAITKRLLAALAEPISSEPPLQVTASAGLTLYPIDGSNPDILLRHADQAMYKAKECGRSTYHIFDPELDRRARHTRDSMAALRLALTRNELRLFYQPKVDLRDGRVIGFEALVRWQHPKEGILLPQDFLGMIADSDLAIEVDLWVMAEALRQMAEWQRAGITVPVSVNVCSRLLLWPEFELQLRKLLQAAPEIAPRQLELEILESSALHDLLLVAQIIDACSHLGVRFALDDFGTGYSSLTYLKRLPATSLKIDRSFVADMLVDQGDFAIVHGIIGLAAAFRREVVAEGVETHKQATELLRLGCHLAQGFGIARPMPANAVPDWTQNFRLDTAWGFGLG